MKNEEEVKNSVFGFGQSMMLLPSFLKEQVTLNH